MPPPNLPNGIHPPQALPFPNPAQDEPVSAPSLLPRDPVTPPRGGLTNARAALLYMTPTSPDASPARETCTDSLEGQSIFMANPNQTNGTSWDPSSLLDPRRAVQPQPVPRRPESTPTVQRTPSSEFGFEFQSFQDPSSNRPPTATPLPHRPTTAPNTSQPSLSFSFASPDDPAGSPAPTGAAPSQGAGMGSMIEHMNNIRDRAFAPPPRKRKMDAPNGEPSAKKPAAPGMLGEYIKEQSVDLTDSPKPVSNTVDLTDGGDDDVRVVSNPLEEEVCYGMLNARLDCWKVPSPKPGTQSLFGPQWSPVVKVVLKRLAGEKTCKIQAYDHTREIIGNVDVTTAYGLSSLLDHLKMRTDCRIPPRQKAPDEVSGGRISRSYPMEMNLYGPFRYARTVGKHLRRCHIRLLSPKFVQPGTRVSNPHTEEYKPPPQKTYEPYTHLGPPVPTMRTVEEVRNEVMSVFDSLADNQHIPEAEPSPSVITPLLKHQKQGLHFMEAREALEGAEGSEHHGPSLWKRRMNSSLQTGYVNVITGQWERRPPQTRGGILADMMGLGKTLSILSLVVGSLGVSQEWDAKTPTQPDEAPNANAKPHPRMRALGLTHLKRNTRATLLVCPLSTITNWEEQIKQHMKPDTFKYHIYHGSNRIKDVQKLAEFDLVITTYGSVSSELSSRSKGKAGPFPLEELGWFRIVLDEAHMIREQATLQFKAICRLQADRRWAVTGTPVQNRLDDLAALLAFIRFKPFDDRSKFTRYIVEPFKICDPEIVPKLRILVDTITLRRLKDKIDLPPRTDQVVRLGFSPEERYVYDMFAKNAQDRVKVLASSGRAMPLSGQTYIHILRSILRLRLICAHGKDLLNEDDIEALKGMTADTAIDLDSDEEDGEKKVPLPERKAYEMFELMQETNNDSCIQCQTKLGADDGDNIESEGQEDLLGYMNPCFHIMCTACRKKFEQQSTANIMPGSLEGPCPACSTFVQPFFVELRRSKTNHEHGGAPSKHMKKEHIKNEEAAPGGMKEEASPNGTIKKEEAAPSSTKKILSIDRYTGPSTKARALVEDLLNSKAESEAAPDEPPIKSVVFSGWTSHLDLIQLALDAAGIMYTRLDGSMSRSARAGALERFRDDNSVPVILVSIMAGGLGLNLTTGSNVYVMEPQYNPAAEAQAIDRVHRLGQRRAVRTVRYIMQDSFEEKMLELQDKKVKLASLSMDGKGKAMDRDEAVRQKLMDLKSLFK